MAIDSTEFFLIGKMCAYKKQIACIWSVFKSNNMDSVVFQPSYNFSFDLCCLLGNMKFDPYILFELSKYLATLWYKAEMVSYILLIVSNHYSISFTTVRMLCKKNFEDSSFTLFCFPNFLSIFSSSPGFRTYDAIRWCYLQYR